MTTGHPGHKTAKDFVRLLLLLIILIIISHHLKNKLASSQRLKLFLDANGALQLSQSLVEDKSSDKALWRLGEGGGGEI